MAAITAFVVSLVLGPLVIRILKRLKVGEHIKKGDSLRLDDLHRSKQNTPTMGGVLILFSIFLSTFLWADVFNRHIQVVVFVMFWLGITGFLDDYLKLKRKSKGLAASTKFMSQAVLGLLLGIFLLIVNKYNVGLDLPFLKDTVFDLDGFYVLFVILVIAGTANAVNLTDGLDGLAIGSVVMVALAFGVLSYVSGNVKLSEYLLVPYIPGTGELTVFCAALFGAGLGFLWFNCYPASIFMGDVGSLALGGVLGTVALLIRKELLLVIVGGIFVMEALSVILQVLSFRFFKRRIFKIAPIHHHFQFLNWPENKVIVRFWIVAGLLAMFTIVTLKIR